MAETTIEWTASVSSDGAVSPGFSFNPWVGCTKVSPGCDRCYAEGWAKRSGLVRWGGERRRTSAANWRAPRRWDRAAAADGRRRRVFCASLGDVFDNQVPEPWRDELWHLIDQTPHLDWLLLTKRPQNIARMLPGPAIGVPAWGDGGWPNVWLGTTAEDRRRAGERLPALARVPAVVRFVSAEPLLEDWSDMLPASALPDWLIVGGESGAGARPMPAAWATAFRDRCAEAGIAFFVKQMAGRAPIPPELLVRQFPGGTVGQ